MLHTLIIAAEAEPVLQLPFFRDPGFWISIVVGIASVIFSILAFVEARKAKKAAAEAGTTVKIQTITIELTEIAQRLDKLDYQLEFSIARDLLNEVTRRLRRLIAPFQNHSAYSDASERLKSSLDAAKEGLENVRPTLLTESESTENAVYFGMQGHFSEISSLVAEIMGLFEAQSIETS